MPPVRFKAPQQVRIKCPKGRIVPLNEPEVKLGKTIVAAAPHRVTEAQLEQARRTLRRYLGRSKELLVGVHATYPVTRKAEGVKMGQGKGAIDHFVARVPAGRVLFHIPQTNPFQSLLPQAPNFRAFKAVAGKLPFPVVFREQNNYFPLDSVQRLIEEKRRQDAAARTASVRRKLLQSLPAAAAAANDLP
ncbi:ribosomal protein L16, putative [Eimeria tenella]|uniref:Ribosomal protein L16, putative n=1 Tax=Eimeria tenella TaxID=5802 RepID=U6KKQ9_EIMTE|nr:ribosomal protein L16, putative [Eimeria tenella]CDJ37386.1 ribosomal protein L16, putative [Eimeria tenella]|eukprot:XP_013228224.1 ribosomal protein L16, putative [Eimeria tenella]